jgi:hypothetical protein
MIIKYYYWFISDYNALRILLRTGNKLYILGFIKEYWEEERLNVGAQ